MFSAAMHLLSIKDLKDLSVFLVRGCYRHAGPKGPEEMFSRERSRGTGPRATGPEGVRVTVGRGPVPRHANRLKQDFQDLARLARFWGYDRLNASWCAKTVPVHQSPNRGKS